MIGMNQIKKRLIYGILIGAGIGLIGIVAILLVTSNIISSYEKGENKDFIKNYMETVVTFNTDVIQGETITSDMIKTTTVHKNTVPNGAILSASQIEGMVAKYNIPSNITLVDSMFGTDIVDPDVRIQEISAILLPTKLTVGEFVDIRFMVPSGIEYVVLTQKQILDISGTTIWMELSEDELLILNGAIVDSYMTEGSKLYAVQYADPTTQIKIDDDALEQARMYLVNKIKQEISGMSDILTTTTPPATESTKTDEAEGADTEIQDTETTQPTTNVNAGIADRLVDLVTTYAIEYRYYVESYNKAATNYQPNSHIIEFMRNHKGIVNTAKEKLSLEARTSIEESISSFISSNDEDDYSSIVSGVDASKSTQQSLRNSVLGN